jgi:hypothetical protein
MSRSSQAVAVLVCSSMLGACVDRRNGLMDPSDVPDGSMVLPSPTGPTTVFHGTVAGPDLSGTVEVTVDGEIRLSSPDGSDAPPTRPAWAVVQLEGETLELSGEYYEDGYIDLARNLHTLGASVSFDASGAPESLEGFLYHPSFDEATVSAVAGLGTSFCGTYADPGGGGGAWNLTVGEADGQQLVGAYTGGYAQGTLDGSSMRGNWWARNGPDSGTFEGEVDWNGDSPSVRGTWTQTGSGSSRGTFQGYRAGTPLAGC